MRHFYIYYIYIRHSFLYMRHSCIMRHSFITRHVRLISTKKIYIYCDILSIPDRHERWQMARTAGPIQGLAFLSSGSGTLFDISVPKAACAADSTACKYTVLKPYFNVRTWLTMGKLSYFVHNLIMRGGRQRYVDMRQH